ncbi:hypothetical protein PFICI_14593 [Pestalotiopsis fici W106-1]|uniref:Uncharacterized protein n=1 Tax=Pestalotiopsis fici (strain W106-1 / CGMCC3.15140) TaxID=1229662 RepID=W3WKF1_PESFW|nr:uncharacterized protein PFICI_14593 [Pestalotiopsis fici W106-1]ETS73647.1 hypothetical protein PFICI_14593 [Pestalotiopsis fici W106-1]
MSASEGQGPLAASQVSSLPNLLTVIITTSVTPSIPNTDLLSAVVDGFREHCPHLLRCRVIVVFDNYDQIVSFARLKKGHVTPNQARDWHLYKANTKKLILEQFRGAAADVELGTEQGEAEFGSPKEANSVAFTTTYTRDRSVTFIEPVRRLGFGLAVRSALRMVETPYVWLQQHDWNVIADVPVASMVEIMQQHDSSTDLPVKYICLPAIRMLTYATSADVKHFPVLKDLTEKLKRDFVPPQQPEVKIPLTPMFFWHDKPHIASTQHYLARVFPSRLAMMRGDFIEDKIGQIARTQMKEGLWAKWATWLYYPDEGQSLCLRHLQGRIWRGTDAQTKQIASYIESNMKNMLEREAFGANVTDVMLDDHDDSISRLF